MTRPFVLVVAFFLSLTAWADRRDLYTQFALGPSVPQMEDRTGEGSRATQAALLAEGIIYYGLSHTLYLGGLLHGTFIRDAAIPGASRQLPDGTLPKGTLYLDSWSVGIGPLMVWRLDTGKIIAPLVRLEVGASYYHYRRVQLVPVGQFVAIAQPAWSELAFGGRALLGLELRYANHLSITVSMGLRRTFGASIPWQLDFPLSVGLIW
jgi:hypothetical protein